jgi:CRP-like cAMP-binding protein
MIIVDGMAEVSRGGRPVALLGRGDVIGEMALLDESRRGRRNATVTAVTDVTVYVGTPGEFRTLLEVAPPVADAIRQTASERVPQAA